LSVLHWLLDWLLWHVATIAAIALGHGLLLRLARLLLWHLLSAVALGHSLLLWLGRLLLLSLLLL
jgi:hypothetical protein